MSLRYTPFLLLLGCFTIEEEIHIKKNNKFDLLYKVEIPLFVLQIFSEDSLNMNLKDERAKYTKIEKDTIKNIGRIEIFYENLNLDELIVKDSSLKFYKGRDYIEFYKFLVLSDTLTKNLEPFISNENYYKLSVFSEKKIIQSNADSISENKLIWIIPIKKIYQMSLNDTIKIIFRIHL
ncbi:MAG: hypothetical protein N2504_03230 [candidate division WOR-3 bacterium]|nr:hypothetical protein [candidate division WOR-3 bacterium]